MLPGGKAVLFTSSNTSAAFNDANLVVQVLATGTRTVVQRGGYHGRYLPSGHLVYLRDGTLFAAPFDLERLTVTGPPVSAVEGVASNEGMGSAQFAVSASGTLVYLPGQRTGGGVPHPLDGSRGEDDAAARFAHQLARISCSRPMAGGSPWRSLGSKPTSGCSSGRATR